MKKNHMILTALLFLSLLSLFPNPAQASPRVFLNDRMISLNQSAFVQNSVLYFPINIVEHMGFQVHLDTLKHSARIIRPGTFFLLKEGSRFITWQQKGLQISQAPIWQDQTLYIPRSLFVNLGAILSYSRYHDEVRISSDLNRLQNIQVFPNDVYTRLVFQFSHKAVYQIKENKQEIILELKGIDTEESETHVPDVQDSLLDKVQIEITGNGTLRVHIKKLYAAPHKLFWLEKPDRLIVDLVKIFQEVSTQSPAPGISLTHTYQGFSFGPVNYYTAKIEPNANVRIFPALGGQERGFGKSTVSHLSAQYQALLGINAGYFNQQGIPLGMLMQDRELISSPLYGRTLLAVLNDGLSIEQSSRSLGVSFPLEQKSFAFHAVNLPRQNQQMVLYTPRFGFSTGTTVQPESVECQVLLDGTIQAIGEANLPIPEDGYVISAQGSAARWLKANAYEGMRALVFSGVWEQWRDVQHLISGGPRLLNHGQIQVSSQQERFQPDIAQGRAPRTALGIGAHKELILTVVDGRQKESRGLSLNELAVLMLEQGAVDAMNLDGGGSSAMVVNHKVINHPSDGHERPVAAAILILPADSAKD